MRMQAVVAKNVWIGCFGRGIGGGENCELINFNLEGFSILSE